MRSINTNAMAAAAVVLMWENDGNHVTMDEAMLTLERALADWMKKN